MNNKFEPIRKNGKGIGLCVVFAAFFLFLLIQQQGLFMQHDDFAYGCLSYGIGYTENAKYYGIGDIVKYLAWHYENWGGRVTFYFLMIVLLRFGIHAVRCFQVLLIFFTSVCTYWILAKELKVKKSILLAIASCLMYGFYGLTVFSDGIMWIAAASTYVWALPFFLGALCLDIAYHKDGKKGKFVGACLLYLFAASSQEQIAVLIIAVTGLRYLNRVFEQKCKDGIKLTKAMFNTNLIFLSFAVIGGAFEILAPGNFGRMESDDNAWFYALSFPERLLTNVNNLLSTNLGTYNHMMLFAVIFGGIMAAVLFFVWYKDNKKLCILHGINILAGIGFLVYAVCRYRENKLFLSSFLVEGLVFLWFSVNLGWLLYKKGNKLIGFLYIGGLCSQLMMLISPTITVRTSIPMGAMFEICIVCIVLHFCHDIRNYVVKMIPVLLFVCAVWNLQDVTNGFLKNAEVHEFNKETLQEFEEANGQAGKRILLAKLHNDVFGNQQPYHQLYIEDFIRWYYNISTGVVIEYTDYDSIQAYYDKNLGYILRGDFYQDAWFGSNGTITLNTAILQDMDTFALEVAIPEGNPELELTITYGEHSETYSVKVGDNSIRFPLGDLVEGQELQIQSGKTEKSGDGRVLSFIVYQLFFEKAL